MADGKYSPGRAGLGPYCGAAKPDKEEVAIAL